MPEQFDASPPADTSDRINTSTNFSRNWASNRLLAQDEKVAGSDEKNPEDKAESPPSPENEGGQSNFLNENSFGSLGSQWISRINEGSQAGKPPNFKPSELPKLDTSELEDSNKVKDPADGKNDKSSKEPSSFNDFSKLPPIFDGQNIRRGKTWASSDTLRSEEENAQDSKNKLQNDNGKPPAPPPEAPQDVPKQPPKLLPDIQLDELD